MQGCEIRGMGGVCSGWAGHLSKNHSAAVSLVEGG